MPKSKVRQSITDKVTTCLHVVLESQPNRSHRTHLQAKHRELNSPGQQPEFERGGESRSWSLFAALQPQPLWLPIESRWKLTVSMSLLGGHSLAAKQNAGSSIVRGEEERLEQALGGGVQSRGTV